MQHTKVFIADAGSTDGTQEIALSFTNRLQLELIAGGLPAAGRNAGARLSVSKYLLFIDADMELQDRTIIRRALALMKKRHLHCVTTNIRCKNGGFRDHFLYAANNLVQYASAWVKPFSTGMFMLFDRAKFVALGGFDERASYAEDYLLSQKVSPARFGIVSGRVQTTNRRFRNMGHLKITRMFIETALNTWNESYFRRDHGYWHSGAKL